MSEKTEIKVAFLCGCYLDIAETRFDIDEEGFVVCPTHKQRRYGWKSKIMVSHKSHPFDYRDPQYVQRPAFGLSEPENERTFWSNLGINIVEYSTPLALPSGERASGVDPRYDF